MPPVRIHVDRDRCEANQVCQRFAPEVFRVDERDQLHLLVAEVADGELRAKVEQAVRRCPRQALALVDVE
jgi:ferredoxin